jgi:hypothetical protein
MFSMCLTVYFITDHPLPLVENDTAYPDISVTVPTPEFMEKIRSVVQGDHIVEAMTSEGCGCGFNVETVEELEDDLEGVSDEAYCQYSREEWQKRLQWVRSLNAYVTKVAAAGPFTIYTAWAGEEGFPIKDEFTVAPEYFDGPPFGFGDDGFGDRRLYHVQSEVR